MRTLAGHDRRCGWTQMHSGVAKDQVFVYCACTRMHTHAQTDGRMHACTHTHARTDGMHVCADTRTDGRKRARTVRSKPTVESTDNLLLISAQPQPCQSLQGMDGSRLSCEKTTGQTHCSFLQSKRGLLTVLVDFRLVNLWGNPLKSSLFWKQRWSFLEPRS